MRSFFYLSFLLLLAACSRPGGVATELTGGPVSFGVAELEAALAEYGAETPTIIIRKDSVSLAPEAYRITQAGGEIVVEGGADAGAMYGALELAEQLRLFGPRGVRSTSGAPHLKRRGVKFNVPLDLRSPSYTDASDAGQRNIPVVWDFTFWTDYLDHLARHRFNYISLWNLHPFPSLVEVPGYEDVALDDVQRSTADWAENYHLHATGLDAPELLRDPEVVRRMSIQDKIDFWRRVMAYGKSRNIDFHLITWNIFTNGTEGKYGITDAIDNEITKDYFRKSVTQCFLTYPDLAGIGLTTGENMHGQPFTAKEDWAYATYGEGMLEAARLMPERRFTFIHRQHQTGAKDIAQRFHQLVEQPNVDFIFCFKYAKAHAMSATEQPYHQKFVEDIGEIKTIWGLRNDSNYHFRWGAPGFVREFIANLPHGVAEGIYYGSDQWIPGRDFLTKEPGLAGRLEIDKHWFHWLLWGRMSYDPTISNERLIALLADRFPETDARKLFAAWESASMVFPTVTGFHWGPVDFKWYPEACKSRPGPAENETGFHDVNRFITLEPHPMAGFQSIPDFVAWGKRDSLLPPDAVAARLEAFAQTARQHLAELPPAQDPELKATLADIETMARLADYYSDKILGATELARFRDSGDTLSRSRAVAHLLDAQVHWQAYTEAAESQYHNPLWTNRVGYVDWARLNEWAAEDVEIARRGGVGKR